MKEGTPKRLRGFGAAFTALTLAACGTGGLKTPEPQNRFVETDNTSGEVLGVSNGPIAQLFAEFESKYQNQFVDFDNFYGAQCVDLANSWAKVLGAPQFRVDWAADMYGAYPDIYDSIPKTDRKPNVGDILVWNDGKGGHTGIATGKIDGEGQEIVFEQNDAIGSPSHEKAYSLGDVNLVGWLRAKAYETPATTEEILAPYLESGEMDTRLAAKAVEFWLETFTTKKEPVVFRPDYPDLKLQITTNLDQWASEIPTLFLPPTSMDGAGYAGSPEIEKVFKAHYAYPGTTKEGDIEIKNLQISIQPFTNFSDADRENGLERVDVIWFKYIHRGYSTLFSSDGNPKFSQWSDDAGKFSQESFVFMVKNGQVTMLSSGQVFAYTSPTNGQTDPAKEAPPIVLAEGCNIGC